jgi:acyl-coenzyme A thioesterase PaaI-like protein
VGDEGTTIRQHGEPAAEPLFEADGAVLVPTGSARGPWSEGALHGGAVAGILARAVEPVPSAQPMRVTRMTLDLTRAVPWAPIRVRTRVVRDGRRVQVVEAVVTSEATGADLALATMSALRIREAPGLVPPASIPPPTDAGPPPPEAGEVLLRPDGPFHYIRAFDVRTIGEYGGATATTWYHLRADLVGGEEITPLQRLAATADLVISGSRQLAIDEWVTVNADLSIFVERLTDSAWLGLVSTVRISDDGIGHTDGLVFDREGRVAHAVKSLLVDRR